MTVANSYLTKTPSASNRRTMTFSVWVKRSNMSLSQPIISADSDGGVIMFDTDDTLDIRSWNGSSYDVLLTTDFKFLDTTSWYHIVVAIDTTQATSTNRVKLYVNGTQRTDFSTSTYPSQNFDWDFNSFPVTIHFRNASYINKPS
jgi:hypothetical protein